MSREVGALTADVATYHMRDEQFPVELAHDSAAHGFMAFLCIIC